MGRFWCSIRVRHLYVRHPLASAEHQVTCLLLFVQISSTSWPAVAIMVDGAGLGPATNRINPDRREALTRVPPLLGASMGLTLKPTNPVPFLDTAASPNRPR